MSVFQKIFRPLTTKSEVDLEAEAYRRAIRETAKVGGRVFGPVPADRRREFFCLDERTWVWHEEWKDETGKQHIRTTRYDIRPQGLFKAQNNQAYQPLTKQEAKNFLAAINRFAEMVNTEMEPILRSRS